MGFFEVYVMVCFCLVILHGDATAGKEWSSIGINYGRIGKNLPSPAESILLMKSLKIGKVKLYDSDSEVLNALANTGLSVVISVKNEEIPIVASSVLNADEWVKHNVLTHYPATKINTITVGNEILSDYNNQNRWLQLVPAMQNIYSSLVRWNLGKRIKVTTTVAMDALMFSSPPSSGQFRDDIAETVVKHMLKFLSNSKSFYFVNVYPYFAYSTNADKIPLNYTLFGEVKTPVEDGGLEYTDMLSAQLDANVAAMAKLGYPNVKIAISETGWPTAGDAGASVDLAATYNRRLVARMLANPPLGTPRRPRAFVPTYLFALFNEDNKPGPVIERNWGLLYPNGSELYHIDMTGKLDDSEFKSLKSVRPFPAQPVVTFPRPIHSSISRTFPRTGQSPPPYYSAAPISQPSAGYYPPNVPSSSPIPSILPYPPPSPMPLYSSPPPPPIVNFPPPCMPYPPSNPAPNIPPPTTPVITPPSPPSNPISPYPPNPPSTSPVYSLWCVAKPTVPNSVLQKAMDYACGAGADCQSVQPNGMCFMPNTVVAHASYAFNSYWQKNKRIGGTCDFGATAMLITMDPSYGECRFGLT
ncbi:probable glucan endo-1,3-beta-glucosidase A6 isoform X2 [Cryptomeria japonica]|uniref:probable glucan endo-1,3-beta-glucosidase A6 isoform X2 n=1 Tax=Cryptomeria japonica TaxID=3369 RepID=UPI0025AC6171|nr:probable glucan endo-1,3-beta-glucosidase A6 isoform X2 [Cryptomeria japonica]